MGGRAEFSRVGIDTAYLEHDEYEDFVAASARKNRSRLHPCAVHACWVVDGKLEAYPTIESDHPLNVDRRSEWMASWKLTPR
jgi:hypothetical protein